MIVTEPGDDLWLNADEVTGLGATVLVSAVLGYAEFLLIALQDFLRDTKREDIHTIQ